MYYTAKVQLTHEVDTPKGVKQQRVTETYLVEALSVTEAEAKVIQDFGHSTLDFEVKSVNQSKIIQVLK
jgi:hypothetical protein